MKKIAAWILLLLFLSACSVDDNYSIKYPNKLNITVSSYPLQFIVERLGGEQVTVKSILPPGADGHTYEPTAKEMVEIAQSDLFLYTGAIMEPYAETIAKSLKDEDVLLVSIENAKEVFNQSSNLEQHTENHENVNEEAHEHGDIDPHFWLDPIRMISAAEHIKIELSHHFPQYAEIFSENFVALKADLEQIDKEFTNVMNNTDNHTLFVSHAAYGYWEQHYGIEQLAIRGISSSNEPSQKELQQLIKQVEELNIPYIILEKNHTDHIATLLANELGLNVLYIHHLSALSEQEIKEGMDYLSIMEQNIDTMEKALRR